jgi:hypothetical protein
VRHVSSPQTPATNTGAQFDGQGLVSIAPDGSLRPLAEVFEGRHFLIPNDIDTGPDGRIYFTVTSTEHTFTMRNALAIILGARRADGGLYVFDPAQPDPRKAVRELMRGLHFANDVAVDPVGRYALVVETGRYRVLRHWLKGPRAGTTDVWLDNLPGIPNGIARRPSAPAPAGGPHRYWLGFTTRRNALLDFLHPHPVLKALLLKMPDALLPAAEPYGLVMLTEATESGTAPGEVIADDAPTGDAARILRVFHNPDGRRVREAASIEESRGVLYPGGDLTDAILAFPLPADLRGTQGR